MTQSMIERVARAIWADYWDSDAVPWEEMDEAARQTALSMACAAIEAMREPSFEMMAAMYEAMLEDKWDGTQAPMCGAGFDAAIDAALNEDVA